MGDRYKNHQTNQVIAMSVEEGVSPHVTLHKIAVGISGGDAADAAMMLIDAALATLVESAKDQAKAHRVPQKDYIVRMLANGGDMAKERFEQIRTLHVMGLENLDRNET